MDRFSNRPQYFCIGRYHFNAFPLSTHERIFRFFDLIDEQGEVRERFLVFGETPCRFCKLPSFLNFHASLARVFQGSLCLCSLTLAFLHFPRPQRSFLFEIFRDFSRPREFLFCIQNSGDPLFQLLMLCFCSLDPL